MMLLRRQSVGTSSRIGFTLVELLVVIGIIALLIGILLPSLAAARRQALRTACLSKLHQIQLGCEVHASIHAGYYPLAGFLPSYSSVGLGDPYLQRYDYTDGQTPLMDRDGATRIWNLRNIYNALGVIMKAKVTVENYEDSQSFSKYFIDAARRPTPRPSRRPARSRPAPTRGAWSGSPQPPGTTPSSRPATCSTSTSSASPAPPTTTSSPKSRAPTRSPASRARSAPSVTRPGVPRLRRHPGQRLHSLPLLLRLADEHDLQHRRAAERQRPLRPYWSG